jgi:hypothetical protein
VLIVKNSRERGLNRPCRIGYHSTPGLKSNKASKPEITSPIEEVLISTDIREFSLVSMIPEILAQHLLRRFRKVEGL